MKNAEYDLEAMRVPTSISLVTIDPVLSISTQAYYVYEMMMQNNNVLISDFLFFFLKKKS